MTVTIEGGQGAAFPFDHRKLAKDVICAAIEEEGFPFEAEVGLLLATLGEIQEINLEQRGLDKPTDVLSFPMIFYRQPGDFSGDRKSVV